MPEFRWRARTAQGAALRGRTEAASTLALSEVLSARGLFLTGATEDRRRRNGRRGASRLSGREKILVTRQLAEALAAGIPLIEVLNEFARNYPKPGGRRVFDSIAQEVSGGGTLHQALASFPRIFPASYVQTVRAGESTGQLDRVFNDLATHLEREHEMFSKVRSAMVYPSILFAALGGLAVLFLKVLLPKFQPLLESAGSELPWITRSLLGISDMFSRYWIVGLVGVPALIVGIRAFIGSRTGRGYWDRIKLSLPFVGGIVTHLALARFTRTVSMLLEAGAALSESLEVSSSAAANRTIERSLLAARSRVVSGQGISLGLGATGFFDSLQLRMIAMAEKTGRLGQTFSTLSTLRERAALGRIQTALTFLEPVMLFLMGGVVVALALSVFLPIYQSLDTVGS